MVARVLLLLLLAGCSTAQASEVVSVHDGDTFTMNGVHWRLWGVDAPELNQTCLFAGQEERCGQNARTALELLVRNEQVDCDVVGHSYDRLVGHCWAGDHNADLSAEMVRNGWALNWDQYSHGAYAAEETEAREHHRGLWSMQFVEPWAWRKSHH